MDPLRVLFIEDTASDTELAARQLEKGGVACIWRRVETEAALRQELQDFQPDVILSDFALPAFGGLEALAIARECAPDVPFVFVSGTIGEERAIEALKRGAVDYVLKTGMARLVPAVERALEHAALQKARRQQEASIARLTRVLRLLSGTTTAVVRVRERRELLAEACRLATGVGGYTAAVVSLIEPGTRTARPTVWAGADDRRMQQLSFAIADSPERDTSVTGRVLRSAAPFACNDLQSLEAELAESRHTLAENGYQSIVALPLLVDKTAVGVFSLMSSERDVFSEEELAMLRELAANLSFALQYQHKEDEVRFLSYFDALTGLAKRSLFCERLARRLEPRVRRRGDPAVAIFDIEQLCTINDSFGRHAGDLLLQRIADRMKSHFDTTDGLVHLGGGTFGIALELEGGEQEVFGQLHEEVAAIVSRPFTIEGRDIPVEVKSGFARFPQNGPDASVLVQNAEAALRAAKASGERYLHHRLEMSSAVVTRLNLEHRLRGAIERQEFELHYQPKVSVATRRIVGVEALLRWRDPGAGLIAPGELLPVLESTGMIVQLGEWILRQAALDVQRWRSAQLPPVRVAVNISPVQLRRRAFTDQFLQVIDAWASAEWGLDIEITESALVDELSSVVSKLRLLRRKGVQVAIDDFGTGYSSLSRLAELPIDMLKIDRTFTSRLGGDATGKTLVSIIIALSKAFGMTTVAEGVETPEQFDLLTKLGCDQSQGYLHSKAVRREELEALLVRGQGPYVLPAEFTGTSASDAVSRKA